MRERLGKFALSLHPDKTRLIEFGRFAAADRERRGLGKPETFDFLGFTHICGKSRKGASRFKRKTRADRMRAKLKAVKEGLRRRMHRAIAEQGRWLGRGHRGVLQLLRRADQRPRARRLPTAGSSTSGGARYGGADRRTARPGTGSSGLARDYLPMPRILHPWPNARFAVKHPRWEPYAGKPHVRICAGGAQ